MNVGRLLAAVQIMLCVAASIGYLFASDYRRALYFFLGAAITATVTF